MKQAKYNQGIVNGNTTYLQRQKAQDALNKGKGLDKARIELELKDNTFNLPKVSLKDMKKLLKIYDKGLVPRPKSGKI